MKKFDWEKIKTDEVTELYSRKVALGENISVARLEVKKGAATRMHAHQNEEIIVVLKGKWRFFLGSEQVTVEPNQMLRIPPGTAHASEVLEDVVAIDVCSPARADWVHGEDRGLHYDPEQYLWAV